MRHNDNAVIIDDATQELAEYVGSILADNNINKAAAMAQLFEDFGDYLKSNITDDPADDTRHPLLEKLEAMVTATGLPLEHFLHTARGAALAERLNNLSKQKDPPMPQVNIMKLIEVTEQGLMAQVTKRDGESYAQSFARRYENDISFRRDWAALTDAKHLMALGKGMATLTPTSTEVGNTNVSDDSAEAVRLLREMADKQHRSFEQVFADPANRALAARTYTAAHRPTASSTSGSELQR